MTYYLRMLKFMIMSVAVVAEDSELLYPVSQRWPLFTQFFGNMQNMADNLMKTPRNVPDSETIYDELVGVVNDYLLERAQPRPDSKINGATLIRDFSRRLYSSWNFISSLQSSFIGKVRSDYFTTNKLAQKAFITFFNGGNEYFGVYYGWLKDVTAAVDDMIANQRFTAKNDVVIEDLKEAMVMIGTAGTAIVNACDRYTAAKPTVEI